MSIDRGGPAEAGFTGLFPTCHFFPTSPLGGNKRDQQQAGTLLKAGPFVCRADKSPPCLQV